MIVRGGSLWIHSETGSEVQVTGVELGLVRFTALTGPRSGESARLTQFQFTQSYTERDIIAEQTPLVSPGETWWNRHMPMYRVEVLSVLNGVVTFKEQRDGDFGACPIERFIMIYTNKVNSPADTSGWPTTAYFIVDKDGPARSFFNAPLGSNLPVVKVPIDWSQAVWEIEP